MGGYLGRYLGTPGPPPRCPLSERPVSRRRVQPLHQLHRVQHVHRAPHDPRAHGAQPAPQLGPRRRPRTRDPATPTARLVSEAWRRLCVKVARPGTARPLLSGGWGRHWQPRTGRPGSRGAARSPGPGRSRAPERAGRPRGSAAPSAPEEPPDPCAQEIVLRALRRGQRESAGPRGPREPPGRGRGSPDAPRSAFTPLRPRAAFVPRAGPLRRSPGRSGPGSPARTDAGGPLRGSRNAIASSRSSSGGGSARAARESIQMPEWPVRKGASGHRGPCPRVSEASPAAPGGASGPGPPPPQRGDAAPDGDPASATTAGRPRGHPAGAAAAPAGPPLPVPPAGAAPTEGSRTPAGPPPAAVALVAPASPPSPATGTAQPPPASRAQGRAGTPEPAAIAPAAPTAPAGSGRSPPPAPALADPPAADAPAAGFAAVSAQPAHRPRGPATSAVVPASPAGTARDSALGPPAPVDGANVPGTVGSASALPPTGHTVLLEAAVAFRTWFAPAAGLARPPHPCPAAPPTHGVTVYSQVLVAAVQMSPGGRPAAPAATNQPAASPGISGPPSACAKPPPPLSPGGTAQPAFGVSGQQRQRAPQPALGPSFGGSGLLGKSAVPAPGSTRSASGEPTPSASTWPGRRASGGAPAGLPPGQASVMGPGVVPPTHQSGACGPVFGSTAPRPFDFGGLVTPMDCGESGVSVTAPDESSDSGLFRVGGTPIGVPGTVTRFGTPLATGTASISASKTMCGAPHVTPFAQSTPVPGPVKTGGILGFGVPFPPAQGSVESRSFRPSAPLFSFGAKPKTPKSREQRHPRRHYAHRK